MNKSFSFLPLLTPPEGGLARLRNRLMWRPQPWYWTVLPAALGSTFAALLFYCLPIISDGGIGPLAKTVAEEQKFVLKNESQASLEMYSPNPNVRIVWVDDLSLNSNPPVP